MHRTADFKAVWRLNHVENANTSVFTWKFTSNDVNIHDNVRLEKWMPRKWSINWKCRMCLLGDHNCVFTNIFFCYFYDSPLFYSQRVRELKGSHNLHRQESVNIKGHTIKFALIQGPLCACPAYRLSTDILRVSSCISPSIHSHIPTIFLPHIDLWRCAGLLIYPSSTCLWRELIPSQRR